MEKLKSRPRPGRYMDITNEGDTAKGPTMAYDRKAMLNRILNRLTAKQRTRDRYMERADRSHDRWAVAYGTNPEQAEGYWAVYCYAQDKAIDLQVEIADLIDKGKRLAGFKPID